MNERGGIFMFLRAQFSSQISSLTDFLVSIIFVNIFNVFYGNATLLGNISGGVVNCTINYKWTFKAQESKIKYVIIKYLMVWLVNLFLNREGTVLVTELVMKWITMKSVPAIIVDNVFLIPKIIVSLIVGYGWNYNMQRLFVYKNMDYKNNSMKVRDFAQQLIYKIINPLIQGMIKIGITPNFVTATGLVLNVVACVIFICGAMRGKPFYGVTHGQVSDLSFVGWGGFVILFAGLFDMMDGQVARIGKMSSRYGALFDSVLDRYSELIVLFGICYYLILQGYFVSSLFAFIALIGSMMVSYVRARAEGLGIECKGGFMQRPERVVTIALGCILCGIFYHFFGNYHINVSWFKIPVFEPILIMVVPIAFVAVFSNITAINRMRHCKRVLQEQDRKN